MNLGFNGSMIPEYKNTKYYQHSRARIPSSQSQSSYPPRQTSTNHPRSVSERYSRSTTSSLHDNSSLKNESIKSFSYYHKKIRSWDEREVINDEILQLQKHSSELCPECRKLFNEKKWCRPCGCNVVYKAIWKQGPIICWDTNINNWKRLGNYEVVLKVIKGSQKNLNEFINMLIVHHKFHTIVGHILRCFGISRWEGSGDFIVVTSYANYGNLRQYIYQNFENFSWIERLITLKDIAIGLEIIHNSDDWIHSKRKHLVIIYNSFQHAENERKNPELTKIDQISINQTNQSISNSQLNSNISPTAATPRKKQKSILIRILVKLKIIKSKS
ncbi:unnamed protein product [Rhizophagus irregularis]|nr:unnamed protein product [Rhizophagus irregularis]